MARQKPATLADQAAEAIRVLNHATLPRRSLLEYPSDVYDVLGALSILVERLVQTFGQLTRFLGDELGAGRVIAVEGQPFAGSPAVAVMDAVHWLEQASQAAVELCDALSNAQQATAGLASAGADEAPEES